jgi:hypothetical protein
MSVKVHAPEDVGDTTSEQPRVPAVGVSNQPEQTFAETDA